MSENFLAENRFPSVETGSIFLILVILGLQIFHFIQVWIAF